MIRTYVCPEIKVPDELNFNKKRSFSATSSSNDSNSRDSHSKNKKSKQTIQKTMTKQEISEFYTELKQFSANNSNKDAKKIYKIDILTKLGVPPPKEVKMPFAMKMRVLQHRKKQATKQTIELKQSGIVTKNTMKKIEKAKINNINSSNSNNNNKKNPKSNFNNGVLKINQSLIDRISKKKTFTKK